VSATLTAPLPSRSAAAPAAAEGGNGARLLDTWLGTQATNLLRHVESLRRFNLGEFGTGPSAPSEAHVEAANKFIDRYKDKLVDVARSVEAAVAIARREPSAQRLQLVLERKDAVANRVLYVEGIWDFYFDLFVQRMSAFAERLRAVDRIAANCYEDLYVGMGAAQPTPRLLPFTYAQSGFGPLTYRRGVPIMKLRRQANPFPLVVIPQHRLANVWALSSVLHEVSHNLQADVGLWERIPRELFARLTGEGGLPESVATVWARWHKEVMADMLALVFGGPGAVESLMDVVGRSRDNTVRFSPLAVHPTPYLRTFINTLLLRRLGLGKLADEIDAAWRALYPQVSDAEIPRAIRSSFRRAAELVIDTMIFKPYAQLANKSVAQIIAFGPAQMEMIAQGARILAEGGDPIAVPPRFMIGAARVAVGRKLATPQAITDNFYRTLGRR
jgi:hypothetical protein